MSKDDLYSQCEIFFLCDEGLTVGIDVVWIPKKFATVGKRIRLGNDGQTWTVAKVYDVLSKSRLDAMRDSWRRFSDVLDGSPPKKTIVDMRDFKKRSPA